MGKGLDIYKGSFKSGDHVVCVVIVSAMLPEWADAPSASGMARYQLCAAEVVCGWDCLSAQGRVTAARRHRVEIRRSCVRNDLMVGGSTRRVLLRRQGLQDEPTTEIGFSPGIECT